MEQIILYTTGCPKCRQLIKKLDENSIQYTINNNIEYMNKIGITTVPMLYVGKELLNFQQTGKGIDNK